MNRFVKNISIGIAAIALSISTSIMSSEAIMEKQNAIVDISGYSIVETENYEIKPIVVPSINHIDGYFLLEDTEIEPIDTIWECPLTDHEMDLLARITMAEAEGESDYGKILVIDTVLNRLDHPLFPDTIEGVIYEEGAFSPIENGRFDACESDVSIINLVKTELQNRSNNKVIFFTSEGYSFYGVPMFQVGNHWFSSYD